MNKSPLRTYTNPITGTIVVGLPDGPPLKKFKKGQEAEAEAWAACVPGFYISINRTNQKYSVDFVPYNTAKPVRHPEFYSLDAAETYIRKINKNAVISVS